MEIQKSPRWRHLYPPKVWIATSNEKNTWAIKAVGGDAKTLGPSSALIRVLSVLMRWYEDAIKLPTRRVSGGKEHVQSAILIEKTMDTNTLILMSLCINHDVCLIQHKNLELLKIHIKERWASS